ncbi:hypothetical protein JZO81_03085 [Enterococcus hulanensis]|nr:hypothetical protein [Enterococcus hulanensis]MBO0410022.1 hypothetical protein [Enterococcus hulanensis]
MGKELVEIIALLPELVYCVLVVIGYVALLKGLSKRQKQLATKHKQENQEFAKRAKKVVAKHIRKETKTENILRDNDRGSDRYTDTYDEYLDVYEYLINNKRYEVKYAGTAIDYIEERELYYEEGFPEKVYGSIDMYKQRSLSKISYFKLKILFTVLYLALVGVIGQALNIL